MQRDNPKEQDLHLLVRSVGLNNVVQPMVTFCISIIIARALGPEGRGGYGVLAALVTTAPMITSIGLAYATRFYCADGSISPSALLKSVSLIGMFLGTGTAACVILAWQVRYPQALWPAGLGPAGITALAVTLFLAAINRFWTFYLWGQERYVYSTWFTTAGVMLQAGALLLAWQSATLSMDIAMAALLLPTAFRFLLFPVLAWGDVHAAVRAPWLSLSELRRMLGFGGWSYLSSILGLAHVQLIIFLLTTLAGFYETGLYTAIAGPANLLLLFSTPLGFVLSSRSTRRIGDANFASQVAASLRLIFCMTGGAALLGLLVAPAIIPWLFGGDFTGAILPFCILLPGIVALALKNVMVQYLIGSGYPRRATAISATTASITLVLAFILIPEYGAAGAAAAVTTAQLCSTLVGVRVFLRLSRLETRQLCMPKSSDWRPLARVLGISNLLRL